MRRMDKEKTTARNCSVGAEQEQSFCIKYTYSISDILSGFNVFFIRILLITEKRSTMNRLIFDNYMHTEPDTLDKKYMFIVDNINLALSSVC